VEEEGGRDVEDFELLQIPPLPELKIRSRPFLHLPLLERGERTCALNRTTSDKQTLIQLQNSN
jgi:hypothetical protein